MVPALGAVRPRDYFRAGTPRSHAFLLAHRMLIKRSATALWEGTGAHGQGQLQTANRNVLDMAHYSYQTRFGDGVGTNPEELIAAAHAGCFSMKLAFNLQEAGLAPNQIRIETRCEVSFENGGITQSHLLLRLRRPPLPAEALDTLVADAKANCPVSRLLNTAISMELQLVE